MLFNSLVFAIFLPLVFLSYWSLRRQLRVQNLFLLAASYLFYGWWDYRFLALIFISSVADFVIGAILDREKKPRARKLLLAGSIAVNIGILGFFKYYGFFVDSCVDLLATLGLNIHTRTLGVILPVGISFYTFQTMSYTIDIYRRKMNATKDAVAFFAFVSFFPQLVAGPIERASALLPQFGKRREFAPDGAKDGLRQILWGLAKKVVVADNLARYVDSIFTGHAGLDSITLLIGGVMFAFQIYCDFSGYSDIAIGVARLFGFRLMRNFAFPFFSRDIAEFWRRWHISLSSWFRDYVFIPLGGSRVSKAKWIRNIVATFTISGLWHGADWNFIAWGLMHGLFYLPLMLTGRGRKHDEPVAFGRLLPRFRELTAMLTTFTLVMAAFVVFRAGSLPNAINYFGGFAAGPVIDSEHWHGQYMMGIVLIAALVYVEWIQRNKQHGLEIARCPIAWRWTCYMSVALAIILFGNFGAVDFIYFQF